MSEVDRVKGVMADNIDSAMSNLESAEELDQKTQEMKQQSNMFNKQAKTAKNQMWWKNMKVSNCPSQTSEDLRFSRGILTAVRHAPQLNIIIAVVVLLIILSIVGSVIWN